MVEIAKEQTNLKIRSENRMVSKEIRNLASEIFKIDPQIEHLGLIDLEGHVLLDQSSASNEPIKPDKDRMMFYYQVSLRRSRREHFNEFYGLTKYVHIVRENIQQLMLYLPMITVYLTLGKDETPDGIRKIAEKVQEIDGAFVEKAVRSEFYQ